MHAPHVEAVRDRGLEVLCLVDPVDELLVQSLPEFEGKRLRSLAKGALADDVPQDETLSALSAHLEQLLSANVKRVRPSTRLTSSPACLVSDEHEATPRMERLLMKPRQRRILELNPSHAVIIKLQERQQSAPDDPRWPDYAELLLSYALLAEGSQPANPVRFSRVLVDLMRKSF